MKLAFNSWPFSASCHVPTKQFLQRELYALLGPCDFDGQKDQPYLQVTVLSRQITRKGEGSECHIDTLRHLFHFYCTGIIGKKKVSIVFPVLLTSPCSVPDALQAG